MLKITWRIFWKIVLCQGTTSFIRHTFHSIMMGWVIKIDDIAANPVKSRLLAVFEGNFQSPKKSNFIDDIAFLELKNDFRAVRWKKSHCLFQFSELNEKAIFKITTLFWKKFKKVFEKCENYDEKCRKSIKNKFV